MSLNHEHITQALLTSDDDGETINLANWGFAEVSEAAGEELSRIGKAKPEDPGVVARIALNSNALTDLPRSLELISRLRYLNLRANAFTVFPAVLTSLPKLEILDISRNTITELPSQPGSLTNLNVFSLARNLITRLPVYFTDFEWLRVLKLEGNPITWPPPDVWNREKLDAEDDAQLWLNELKAWLLVNYEDEIHETQDVNKNSSDDEVLVARTHLARPHSSASNYSFQHGRSYSTDSELSLTSFESKPSEQLEPAFVPSIAPSSSFTTLPIQPSLPPPHPFEGAPAEPSTFTSHARGVSYSAETSTKASRRRTQILGKKSMPNLRSSTVSHDVAVEQRLPVAPQNPQKLDTSLEGLLSESSTPVSTSATIPATRRQPHSAKSDDSNVPIDDERNHYFRRVSSLPKPRAEAPQRMPPPLLQTVDAIRGILFSLSQIYSAVRNYTASAIDERTLSVLLKVLDPASSYLSGLISALERFDTVSETGGIPPPDTCRTLIASCRDNVAVFGKVVGVLQVQLKVLASSHDPRYTRTLLLMLYGSMAEISHSWEAMLPHLASLVPHLRQRQRQKQVHQVQLQSRRRPQHHPSLSGDGADVPRPLRVDGNISGKLGPDGNIMTTEKTPSPPPPTTGGGPSTQSRRMLAPRARRNAGSFSTNDVEAGRALPGRSPSEASYLPGTSPSLPSPILLQRPVATRNPSNSSLHQQYPSQGSQLDSPLQPPSAPFAATSRSHARGQSNSSSGSMPSPSQISSSFFPPAYSSSGPGLTPSGAGQTASPQVLSTRSRSRTGDYPTSAPHNHHNYHLSHGHHPQRRPSTADSNVNATPTTSRLVDADLLDAMELAANHAHIVWTMLEDILKSTSSEAVDGNGDSANASSGRNREQLWEALERVQSLTVKMMAYFSEARDGDSGAGKKALGEDAQMFVKATVQILVLLKAFATTHALPPHLREGLTKLTSAMQDVTVFLHVSSYAPTPTPVPPLPHSAALAQVVTSGQQQPLAPPGLSSNPGVSPSLRPFSPAMTFMPAHPLSGALGGGGNVGIGSGSNGNSGHTTDERGSGFAGVGAGPGYLSRSKSATAGPTPLKLGISTTTGGNGVGSGAAPAGRDLPREPPHSALPQSQAFRFGH